MYTSTFTQFLLHQINTDLIASNLNEATVRIDLAESLINEQTNCQDIDLAINHQDIVKLKNHIHLNYPYPLKITNMIKNLNFRECFKLVNKFLKLRTCLFTTPLLLDTQKQQQMINLFNELFIEIYLNLCNALQQFKHDEHHHLTVKE